MNFNTVKEYRPDIDGLRAIAVIVILLFHTGYEWASGGFIGVDVFFVISGYLITRNILFNIKHGTFSFVNFYIRRIRRLFPALLFILFLSMIFGYLLFSPTDFERLGNSLLYTMFSVSNIFFWNESDYFHPAMNIRPLLHTWSLGVEEQFYLIWPAMVLVLCKIKKNSLVILFFVILTLISLYFSELYINQHSETVFFLLPFRIFEFSIGALCVFFPSNMFKHKWLQDLLIIIGLVLIFFPFFSYSPETVFPGLSALIPCLGGAIIIISGKSSLSNILLGNKVFVKIGLISYSTYLIHWPLFLFYKYWKFKPIDTIEIVLLFLASLVLGHLMWKYIEQPFRYNKEKSHKLFLLSFSIVVIVLATLSINIKLNKGYPSRFPAEYLMSKNEVRGNLSRYRENYLENILSKRNLKNNKKVVIMGNSHAVDLLFALNENKSDYYFSLLKTTDRCYNFGTSLLRLKKPYCSNLLKKNISSKKFLNADLIYLHDNWARLNIYDLEERLKQFRLLTNAPIYVFGPKMVFTKSIPQIVKSHMRIATVNQFSQKFILKSIIKTNDSVKQFIKTTGIKDVYFIDVLRAQCGEKINECQIVSSKNNKFLYFDGGHLTLQGAKDLGEKLKIIYPEIFYSVKD